ncbi:MAG: hypothetical protein J6N81_06895, partial [Treponema sp.]|nr:hypothetical protein [Treponema sp.]
DIAGDPTADGAGESEEAAEEDDDKSFLESVCEAVGGVVDAVGDAVSGLVDTVTDAVSDAAHAVGEVIEDVIDFFTGGSEEKNQTQPVDGDTGGTGSQNKTSNGTGKDNPEDKNSKNGEKTEAVVEESKTASTASKYGCNGTDSPGKTSLLEKTDNDRCLVSAAKNVANFFANNTELNPKDISATVNLFGGVGVGGHLVCSDDKAGIGFFGNFSKNSDGVSFSTQFGMNFTASSLGYGEGYDFGNIEHNFFATASAKIML